ncbi:MAG: glycosyltransferase family 2 protein [Hyphomicrobiaceae bacterium]
MPAAQPPAGVVAGVVAFRPRPRELERIVDALAADAPVLVYRNSVLTPGVERELSRRHGPRLAFIGTGVNLGLGAAYNVLAHAAAGCGAARLVLFDQDSAPGPGLVPALAACMDDLVAAGHRPAAVGPVPQAADERHAKTPRMVERRGMPPHDGARPVEFLISSGCLIELDALRAVGGFREDFFIDAIDIEWCLRAWHAGYSCWLATGARMPHRLGAGVMRIPLLGVNLVRQPPVRIYTFLRNQLAMLRLGPVGWRWKARAVPRLLVHSAAQVWVATDRSAMLRSVVAGWRDGLRGHLGAPPQLQRPVQEPATGDA